MVNSIVLAGTIDIDPSFTWKAWIVVATYMLLTTWLGHVMSGKQATIRDFFLGGRKLPWYAVSGSVIATELSAMTLVSVPAFIWLETGDMKYAVLAIGNIIGRILVGMFFVPKFYEEEIYSPYEYIGNNLGQGAQKTTSLLFMIGGMLGQGTRVLLTAIVLNVVTGWDIHLSIWIVGLVSVVWTWMGGMTTVIWTDVVQFVVLTLSAFITLFVIISRFPVEEGQSAIPVIWNFAVDAGKTTWLDWNFDITANYTIWTSLVGASIGGLAAYGTDQLMAQRMFCCQGPKQARRAIIWSSLSQILMLICLLMGIALWAYYKKAGLGTEAEIAFIDAKRDRLLPVFIKYHIHWAFGGLMVAGIFAAAISSLDSILAALSQQSMDWIFHNRSDKSDRGKTDIFLSRVFVIFWAVVLCGMASMFQIFFTGGGLLVELALAVVGYTSGAILGTFMIALIPGFRRSAKYIPWVAALSVLSVVAVTRHSPGDMIAVLLGCIAVAVGGMIKLGQHEKSAGKMLLLGMKFLLFFLYIMFLNGYTVNAIDYIKIGWPWYTPLGASVMIAAALIIGKPPSSDETQALKKAVEDKRII